MYVIVKHNISDIDRYWKTVQEATPNIPDEIKLHQCLPSVDGKQAMCVWEGPSLEQVRDLVEETVGEVSNNEYFEAEAREGVNIPSAHAAAS